ncbi:protein kinase, partial [Novipirellula sp.]|uniref:protein kinase domain-containing protein n=1 Tax=Novipirellula sp. TaxID=2795430 RepID=UPI003564CA7C
KPANVMLNRRGCEPDVVKVLDFGLVKAMEPQTPGAMLGGGTLTGTPLYMSPEAIQAPMSVDARTDIYAVGAVAYFLLTGEPVFAADGLTELCQKHIDEAPVAPSKRGNTKVSSDLEDAILSCLEKSRAKRPQTARDLAQLLLRCNEAKRWTIEDGDRWWGRHERGSGVSSRSDVSTNASAAVEATLDLTQLPTERDDPS